jgi:hypothetical protein
MARMMWRAAVITHRYLGVAVGLLMLMWFGSGIVMMYVAYPEISAKERVGMLSPISWQACCAFSQQKIPDDRPIQAAQIENLLGAPVLRVKPEAQPVMLADLQKGGAFELDAAKARTIASDAAARIIGAARQPVLSETIDHDQWTVGENFERDRPLHHFVFDDPERTHVYVSSVTGEVVLWTRAGQRFWNWLGSIPHWLYFAQLRSQPALWTQVVVWTSILGGFLTVLGLILGIAQFKRGKSGRVSPYRGWFYWHHIAGLVFGLITLTWVVSGTLSVNPWGLLEGRGGNERVRLAGEPIAWSAMRSSLQALKASPPDGETLSVSAAPLNGKLFWLATGKDGRVQRLDALGRPAPVSEPDLAAAAQRLAGGNAIESQQMIGAEDSYYFGFADLANRNTLLLPVYRVVLSDAEHTRYYLDPRSAALLGKIDAGSRGYRWWFNGLHRVDFTAWLRVRPFWDALMLVLLLGGVGVTATGAYLAFTRIRRDLGFR